MEFIYEISVVYTLKYKFLFMRSLLLQVFTAFLLYGTPIKWIQSI